MITVDDAIDMCGMKTVYAHLANNLDIEQAVQVMGDREELVRIGELATSTNPDDLPHFVSAFEGQKAKFYTDDSIPADRAVYVFYCPPYYFFTDAGKDWK